MRNDDDKEIQTLNLVCLIVVIVFLCMIFQSCAQKEVEQTHHNIKFQRLVKRDYFAFGFTNQLGNLESAKTYDLRDEKIRKLLIANNFFCRINKLRYKISGFDANLERKSCSKFKKAIGILKPKGQIYCPKKNVVFEFIDIEAVPIGTTCRSKE